MSTCKDCLHIDVCKDYASYDKDSIISCDNFKNKADYAPVVRCKYCKDCELCYPVKVIGEEAIEGYYCHTNRTYVKPTDFCSYGERKESEVRE